MHEISVIEALLEAVRAELQSHPGARLRTIRIRLGALRLVEPATLQFCFEAAVKDSPLANSRLEIQQVEARARCNVCSLEFPVEESWFECPRCASGNARLQQGDELLLSSLEIENIPSRNVEPMKSHAHC